LRAHSRKLSQPALILTHLLSTDTVAVSQVYLSAITLFELELGVLRTERRDTRQGEILRAWLNGRILPRFDGHILAIDTTVALVCARLHVPDPRSNATP